MLTAKVSFRLIHSTNRVVSAQKSDIAGVSSKGKESKQAIVLLQRLHTILVTHILYITLVCKVATTRKYVITIFSNLGVFIPYIIARKSHLPPCLSTVSSLNKVSFPPYLQRLPRPRFHRASIKVRVSSHVSKNYEEVTFVI